MVIYFQAPHARIESTVVSAVTSALSMVAVMSLTLAQCVSATIAGEEQSVTWR